MKISCYAAAWLLTIASAFAGDAPKLIGVVQRRSIPCAAMLVAGYRGDFHENQLLCRGVAAHDRVSFRWRRAEIDRSRAKAEHSLCGDVGCRLPGRLS